MSESPLPAKQTAVLLTGPEELEFTSAKDVPRPGPHQVLLKVEAVGLCFSDLKLLKQFSSHARKSSVVEGLLAEELREIPSYVPGERPTVLGHEVAGRIVAVGEKVESYKPDQRVLVLPDFREVATEKSNAAFGYNFEGGLQEYVLLDERVVVGRKTGERYLIPVDAALGASQVALVEPWSCVEDSYVTAERQTIKPAGRLLVVAEPGHQVRGLTESLSPEGRPAEVIAILPEPAQREALAAAGLSGGEAAGAGELPEEGFDDVVYFGASKQGVEALNGKLAREGILNIVTGGRSFGAPVSTGVGRIHYGLTRWVGTPGHSAAEGYATIPPNGEIRDGDNIMVIGAGGPMGQMHVIRSIFSGRKDLRILATDNHESRLQALRKKTLPLARTAGVRLDLAKPEEIPAGEEFSYFALMAPLPELVEESIQRSAPGAIINLFAGIPSPVRHELDIDHYLKQRCFLYGTSGSNIRDMKIVLDKVTRGALDTDASVDAVSGMAGAIEGLNAMKERTLAGKIVVYPQLGNMGLIPLGKMHDHYPTVAEKMEDGQWCRKAEAELLHVAGQS